MRQRLAWVEAAMKATQEWIDWATEEANMELTFSMPGDFDGDYSYDQLKVVERSRETLKALEAERELILERERWRQSASERGKYRDG